MSEIVAKKPNIDPQEKTVRARSRVPFSQKVAMTARFGEYTPHFVMEGVNNDNIDLRCSHKLRSYTMKAPLMNDINIKKDYFQVPMEAILPLNWDKIFTNPVIGDDVADNVNCYVTDLPSRVMSFVHDITLYVNSIISGSPTVADYNGCATLLLKGMFMVESVFSAGSLPSLLNCHLTSLVTGTSVNFDVDFDSKMSAIEPTLNFKVNGISYSQYIKRFGFHNAFQRFRDDSDWFVNETSFTSSQWISWGFKAIYDYLSNLDVSVSDVDLNLSRLFAYQIVCSHFYTNDKIDYVYSAELYRQLLLSTIDRCSASLVDAGGLSFINSTFVCNGLSYRYDAASGYYFEQMFVSTSRTFSSVNLDDFSTFVEAGYDYLRLIFGLNRSLRFVDYFTGAKSQPLAVGDVNVAVNGSVGNQTVSVIDITKKRWSQKFLNFVNRTGRRFEEQVSKLNGRYVAPDWHNPMFLGHTTDIVGSEETDNTGAAQTSAQTTVAANTTSQVLKSYASRYAFQVEVDRPSVIIGITYFDIPRFYAQTIERQWFHANRFDMFNPFMQFIGDQPILKKELDPSFILGSGTFGYGLRHIEYKTRVNQASGGFICNQLPGWEFLADANIPKSLLGSIGPDYIRSRNSELDPFYAALTGVSLGTYFHFIILSDNECNPVRPMVYAPDIQ